ncbi:MAG: shikimate dehydrogenase [Armatimonadetes bacterium]|nr:shikimate dehydrogenase [Armatimonadota bacterium]
MIPISGKTRVAAVWGYPVAHSASPAMHNAAFAAIGFDAVYVALSVAPENIAGAVAGVRAFDLLGVNVTVPLKELVMPHLDSVSETARAIGAVNTIVNRNGELWGDSTDGAGFLAAIESTGVAVNTESRFVVLGAGGSARAVVYALAERGANVVIANRNADRAQTLANDFAHLPGQITRTDYDEAGIGAALAGGATALINTTSVGMQPNADAIPPVPIAALSSETFVADLIYKPRETLLLVAARERGCQTQNGAEMLVRQGAIAFEYWTGTPAPLDIMRQAIR